MNVIKYPRSRHFYEQVISKLKERSFLCYLNYFSIKIFGKVPSSLHITLTPENVFILFIVHEFSLYTFSERKNSAAG